MQAWSGGEARKGAVGTKAGLPGGSLGRWWSLPLILMLIVHPRFILPGPLWPATGKQGICLSKHTILKR